MAVNEMAWRKKIRKQVGCGAGLGDSFSHAARATGVAMILSNSANVKRPKEA